MISKQVQGSIQKLRSMHFDGEVFFCQDTAWPNELDPPNGPVFNPMGQDNPRIQIMGRPTIVTPLYIISSDYSFLSIMITPLL